MAIDYKNSPLEAEFERQLQAHGISYRREVKAIPKRRFRVDFVIDPWRIAVEIEGGIWLGNKGRHTNPVGYQRDCEKYNLLALNRYALLRFTTKHVKDGSALATTLELIELKKEQQQCSNLYSPRSTLARCRSIMLRLRVPG
ncbi:endonuclease domain-containing protein [Ferrimonas balearica]|uniref:endonuclease domain-containing protein n=1 Tax=Ferrimonas balearica TaxID=44012 RepID=UPI001C984440|nr:endonuclease domain-containing protein [Ferrimonas balearica]MBY6104986.1 endonuclease domain-containing protein [Ferrimonas balearica]